MDSVIDIEGLSIAFDQGGVRTEVLHELDLKIAPGEFVAIVGPSGVGKSTLLRVLIGLATPSAGTVRLNPDVKAERAMALVFQDSRLLPWRRILANVCFGLEKTQLSRAERRERALATLAGVGLRDVAGRFPHQLSGGQRQRVALARALAVRPAILLMDEPFSALDVQTREGLQDELIRVQSASGQTVLFVTHDIDEAVYLADRVVALGGHPGEVKISLEIDVPHPRSRENPHLRDFAARIRAVLFAETLVREDWVI
ncbi:MAG: ABC transporter ATP-binding protein [Methylobacteriaceae bacterium]|nr:ABC transporter ATP-binding protein [Methylobacteriaceae bacterium]